MKKKNTRYNAKCRQYVVHTQFCAARGNDETRKHTCTLFKETRARLGISRSLAARVSKGSHDREESRATRVIPRKVAMRACVRAYVAPCLFPTNLSALTNRRTTPCVHALGEVYTPAPRQLVKDKRRTRAERPPRGPLHLST